MALMDCPTARQRGAVRDLREAANDGIWRMAALVSGKGLIQMLGFINSAQPAHLPNFQYYD